MLIAEPVQNSGGSFVPPPGYWQGLRELCDRYGILLCADEVICAWGRLGEWFGSHRFDVVPDLLTFAKGLTSAYFALGGVLMHDRVAAPLLAEGEMFDHGLTFGGHPVGSAVALKNIEIIEREGLLDNVRANEPWLQARLDELRSLELVGDIRGMGHFWAIELVADRDSKRTFEQADADWLLRDFLSGQLERRGLIARLDDRGDPVLQVSPPLVADRAVLGEMLEIIGSSLDEAGAEFRRRGASARSGRASARMNADVIVVGGGLAGLNAARDLVAGGADVVVLEARGRPGGRVEQTRMADGRIVQLGGEVVGSFHEAYIGLVAELGLTLVPAFPDLPGEETWVMADGHHVGDDPPWFDDADRAAYARAEAAFAALARTGRPRRPVVHPDASRWTTSSAGLADRGRHGERRRARVRWAMLSLSAESVERTRCCGPAQEAAAGRVRPRRPDGRHRAIAERRLR